MADPGKFVHLVYIYNPIQSYTDKGDIVNQYDDSAPPANGHAIRMSIEPVLGRELVVAKGIFADISCKLRSWYTAKLTPLSRVYWNSAVRGQAANWIRIEIAGPISPDYQNREMWCYGVEIRNWQVPA